MNNKIGIVMGGYLDENGKLMDRTELNKRIASIQKENKAFREALESASIQEILGYGMPENEAIKFRMRKVFYILEEVLNKYPESTNEN